MNMCTACECKLCGNAVEYLPRRRSVFVQRGQAVTTGEW